MPRALRVLLSLLCLCLLPAAQAGSLRLGLLAPEGSFDALHSWNELERHLERSLPDLKLEVRHLPHAAMHAAIARGELDFFIANSGFYVEAQTLYGVTALATLDAPTAVSPKQGISTTIVVRADRADLRELRDLAGRRVVAVHPLAFSAYQAGLHALKLAGVEREDLQSLEFTGLPMQRLLDAVRSGRADAAILRSCMLEKLAGGAERRGFKVLGVPARDRYPCARSHDLYPDWPFSMLAHVDPALATRVSVALLSMPRTGDGYAWTVPADYSNVRRVFRDLQIGPYADLRKETLGNLVHEYRHWVAFAVLIVAGGLLHILRAESLVRVRTRALRGALAERNRIEQEARAKERQLDHLSRLGILGEMSTMLAHELNQPLSAIGNFAQGIVRRVRGGRDDPAVLIDAGEQIARQAERAAGILQRVRDFARNRPSQCAVIDLREVFAGSLALFRDLTPEPPAIEVRLDPGCGGSALVWADRLQLSQVLLNLFKNACEAMAPLPPAARRIDLLCRRDAGEFVIDVSDNGSGLQSMSADALFAPFATSKRDGLGLGLAICKRVVEAHGGRIGARSNDPRPGLTVTFTLPVHVEPEPAVV